MSCKACVLYLQGISWVCKRKVVNTFGSSKGYLGSPLRLHVGSSQEMSLPLRLAHKEHVTLLVPTKNVLGLQNKCLGSPQGIFMLGPPKEKL